MARHDQIDRSGAKTVDPLRAAAFVPHIEIGAFPLSEEVETVMTSIAADRRMSRTTLTCDRGGIDTAIGKYADHFSPGLLLVEVNDAPETLFRKLDHLAERCRPETMVVLLGSRNDVGLYRGLRRSGVSDYLVTPVTPLDVVETLSGLFEDEAMTRRAPVTAFLGVRGGCGSSTLAQNTAWAIAETCGTSALLIDCDLAGGTSALRLDIEASATVATALKEGERLETDVLDRMIMRKDRGFALLASPADLTDISDYEMTDFRHVIDVARSTTSHVVLDLPSGFTRYVRGLLELSDQIVLVAMPDLVSLRNCGLIVQAMRKARPNDPLPRVILSQTGVPRSQQITPEQFAKGLGIPVAAQVPFDAALFSAADNEGRLVMERAAKSLPAKQFATLARELCGQASVSGRPARPRSLPKFWGLFS